MATKKSPPQESTSLADTLFPAEEEVADAILDIPPEKRILRTEQYDFSVATLVDMMDKGTLKVPEFQRRYVWSDRQASRLIESLIIQCPIPVIYLNQEKDETFSVIDGNQRLNSFRRFLDGSFALTGLTSYPELGGLKYSELDVRIQRHISFRVLRCTLILKETHPQVKFDVFERLNTGAVALTRQELRHGLYYGKLLKAAGLIAKKLKLDKHFGGRKDKRMKAEELVIRYWALSRNLASYEKPLASFISKFAEENRNPGDDEIAVFSSDVLEAYTRAVKLFGANSFSFFKKGARRFNAAVFDAQMVSCAGLTPARFQSLAKKRTVIQQQYALLQKDDEYARSITLATSDKSSLQGRIQKVSSLLKSLL